MNQINVSLIGDEKCGKKTFLNLITDNSQQEIQNSPYFPLNIQDYNTTFNFFLTNPGLKNLNKTLQKVMISDILVLFYDLVEDDENDELIATQSQNQEDALQQKETQLNKYKSILEPIFECLFYLNMEKRIIILLNKIDHPQVDYSEDVIDKAIQYFKNMFQNNYINSQNAFFIPVSALKNENITQLLEGQRYFFFETLMNICDKIQSKIPQAIEQYLPLRISVLKIHKIIGVGIVAQGIVLSGELNKNDDLLILPKNKKTKAKELQIYNVETDTIKEKQIVGINLQGIKKSDIKKGYILTNFISEQKKVDIENEIIIKASFIYTFNGIYPGFQLNLIGYNMQIPCFVQKILSKVDFENNQVENTKEDDEIAEKGSVCVLSVQIIKNFFLEKYEDFAKLGQFIIVESNVVLGFAEILSIHHNPNINNNQFQKKYNIQKYQQINYLYNTNSGIQKKNFLFQVR